MKRMLCILFVFMMTALLIVACNATPSPSPKATTTPMTTTPSSTYPDVTMIPPTGTPIPTPGSSPTSSPK